MMCFRVCRPGALGGGRHDALVEVVQHTLEQRLELRGRAPGLHGGRERGQRLQVEVPRAKLRRALTSRAQGLPDLPR